MEYVARGGRAVRSDLLGFNCFDLDVTKARCAMQRLPSSGVSEIKAEFRSGKIRGSSEMQTAHETYATGTQDPANFRKRSDKISPEVHHADRENSIKTGVGEGHALRIAEVEAGLSGGYQCCVEATRFLDHCG